MTRAWLRPLRGYPAPAPLEAHELLVNRHVPCPLVLRDDLLAQFPSQLGRAGRLPNPGFAAEAQHPGYHFTSIAHRKRDSQPPVALATNRLLCRPTAGKDIRRPAFTDLNLDILRLAAAHPHAEAMPQLFFHAHILVALKTIAIISAHALDPVESKKLRLGPAFIGPPDVEPP